MNSSSSSVAVSSSPDVGHSVETHLAAYSKWCGDDVVDDASERAAARLGR